MTSEATIISQFSLRLMAALDQNVAGGSFLAQEVAFGGVLMIVWRIIYSNVA